VSADLDEARRFLDLLGGPDARFTFQTFDDDHARREKRAADAKAAGEAERTRVAALGHDSKNADRAGKRATAKADKDPFAKVLHGTFKQRARTLERLNAQCAGIFVTVNETDLKGRNADNVTRVRAIFADLDGVDLEEAKAKLAEVGLVPHITVMSSPGRWHLYMLVTDFPLASFTDTQQRLIKLLGSDPAVHDLPRVMRLPGFLHQKGEPFPSACVMIGDHEPYGPEAFELLPIVATPASTHVGADDDPITAAVERLGLILGDGANGGYNITCPWEAEHSTLSAPSATTYWPARGGKPGFKCQHAHCARRTVKDFIAELRRRDHMLNEHYKAKAKTNAQDQALPPDYDSEPTGEQQQTNGSTGSPFPSRSLADINDTTLKDPLRRVGGLIGEGNHLTLIFGPSTAGKTFLVLDLVFALLLGCLWFGRKTLRCGVLYIAREGEEGFYNRVKAGALKRLAGLDLTTLPPLDVITVPVNLGPLADGEHVDRIIATIKEMNAQHPDAKVGVVVYDNMRAVAPGMRESFPEEIEAFYSKTRRVAVATGAAPIIIDNTGKDTDRGARGTQAKFDLADTVVEVEHVNGARAWGALKVRDGQPGGRCGFRLEETQLGCVDDVDGEPKDISSAVVMPDVSTPKGKKPPPPSLKIGLRILDSMLTDPSTPENQPLGPNTPLVRTVEKEAFRKQFYQQRGDLEDAAARRQAFNRFLNVGKSTGLLNTQVLDDNRVIIWRTYAWPERDM
jgi:hypothetical protein